MNDSILTSVKEALGIAEEYEHFDSVILLHINSVFMILSQIGVGPIGGFRIEDDSTEWSEYISVSENMEAVKTYMYLKVKLLFDPPPSSVTKQAMEDTLKEIEWRLNFAHEGKE